MVFRRVKLRFRARVKLRKVCVPRRPIRRYTHTAGAGATGFTHDQPAGAKFPGPTPFTPLAHTDLSYSNPIDIHQWEKKRVEQIWPRFFSASFLVPEATQTVLAPALFVFRFFRIQRN